MADKENKNIKNFEIDNKNYAKDPDISAKARKFLSDASYEVYSRRQTLDRRYMEYYNIFRTIFDTRFYEGTSEVYVPLLRKNIEGIKTRLKKAIFPTDDIIDVIPVDPEMYDNAQVVKTHLRWQIEKKIKIKAKLDRFLNQFLTYGWCPVGCFFEHEEKKVVGLRKQEVEVVEKLYDELTETEYEEPTGEIEYEIIEEEKTLVTKHNPTFDIRDIFGFYIYPYTANDLDEAFGVFDLAKKAKHELIQKEKDGEYLNTELIRDTWRDSSEFWSWTKEERLNTDGLSDHHGQLKGAPYLTLITYWGKFNWGDEDKPDYKDTVITSIQNDIILQIRKNPYYDQEIPYVMGKLTELQNEAYGTGYIEPLASLQYYFNDTLNQTFDSILYTLNPIVKYDPGAVSNINSMVFAPGAMWAINDPSAVQFDRLPDVSHIGFNAANQVKQYAEEFPGMQSIPLTGRKAATHISAIQQEYSIPIIDIAEKLEEQVFSPWTKKAYCRNQQFVNEEQVYLVTGAKGVKNWQRLTPEILVGDYYFRWLGSNQATNIHVKSKQMLQFLQSAAPLAPLLAQEGVKLNVSKVLKRIWSEGLDLDGAEEILENAKEDRSIDPQTENMLLNLGKYVPVSVNDDDDLHLQEHGGSGPIMQRHIQEHNMQKQMKQALQTMPKQSSGPGVEGSSEVEGERALESLQP